MYTVYVYVCMCLCPQVHEELSRLRQQSRGVSGSAAMIRRLEAERDDARLELTQVLIIVIILHGLDL